MIPKKIHYCWFGPKSFPKLVVNCINTWREKLPEYELCFWNETNSPMVIPFVSQAYNEKKYAFVSDYVRFWALYQHGGIYMDTDMYVIKSFDNLLDHRVFFAWETIDKKHLSCGVIGSVPEQSFIGKIKSDYESLVFDSASISKLVIPHVVSSCYDNYQAKEEVSIFPYDYFYPFPYEEKENKLRFIQYRTEKTYAIHLWNISWGKSIDKLRDKLLYYVRRVKGYLRNEKK